MATAAAYLDMSDREFSRMQAVDGFPPSFDRTSHGQPVWLKDALDRWLDGKAGQESGDDEEAEYKRRVAAIAARRKEAAAVR